MWRTFHNPVKNSPRNGYLRSSLLLGVLLCCPATTVVAQDAFKWVDDQGRTHYSQTPPAGRPSQPVTTTLSSYTPTATPQSGTADAVTLFTTRWCGVCKKAKSFLKRRGVDFVEHDIERSADAKRRFNSLNGRGVPLILVGDQRMNGFSAPRLERLLEQVGQ